MSRYDPVVADPKRHQGLRDAAQSGTSWHVPALAGTGKLIEQRTLNLRVRGSSLWRRTRFDLGFYHSRSRGHGVLVKSDRSAGSGQTTFWPMAYRAPAQQPPEYTPPGERRQPDALTHPGEQSCQQAHGRPGLAAASPATQETAITEEKDRYRAPACSAPHQVGESQEPTGRVTERRSP
jgi:hypothetical protein